MTKYYFIRKNQIVHCREVGVKGNYTRVWYRAKICADGWEAYDIHRESISEQLEKELKEGKLTPIPTKLFEKNRAAWAPVEVDKELD